MKQWKKLVAGICLTFVIGNYGVVAAEPMGRIEFEELQRRAEFGDGEALYDLARMYEKSTSNPENKNIAKDYLVRSARSGYSEGEYYLGYSYFFEGKLMEKDFEKAHFWLSKAVAKENKQAFFLLGLSYLNGEGVPKDIKKGEAFLVKAGTGGTAGIQKFLGDSYYEGSNSLTQNKEKAIFWYEEAAKQGDKGAQEKLKEIYFATPETYSKAEYWSLKGAEDKKAKSYLEQKGVNYEEINVEHDAEGLKELVSLSGQQSVPVVNIDGKIVIGFDRNKIDEYLQWQLSQF